MDTDSDSSASNKQEPTVETRPERTVRWPAAMVVISIGLGLIALWLQNLAVPLDEPYWGIFGNQLDLEVYRQGAQAVLDGHRLYEAKLVGVMDYTYAPASVFVFVPFALMTVEIAKVVWMACTFIALYFVVTLSFRSLGYRITWPVRSMALSLVMIATLMEPVRTTMWYGQINVFLMLLILWDLLRDKDSRLRGLGVGIAAGIKLTPLIFVFYLAINRNWRSVIVACAGFVGTVVLGFLVMPRDSWKYWSGTFIDSERVGAPNTVGNQSIRGALANLWQTDSPNILVWGTLALAALVLGMVAASLAHRVGHELLAITLVGMTGAVVSPMSWGHHWVWVVPLLVFGVHLMLSVRATALRILAAVGVVALLLTTFIWRTYRGYPVEQIERVLPDAYFTGLFHKFGITWLRWFTYDPYNWLFLVVAVISIICLTARRPADRVSAG
ncbi:glycosyltransferase 87 family protein [Nocardia sp. 348MFTsu5.1]|uniref:glycosyltransferase 87 family protein n=1 Tax=Nocardia sp. 348MFTsu5.1 TaxID=1172185 RepID=UPI001E4E884C|nr:glycosyltransferase 87 family protein [Nocardia sp. 348MFTsu5.1]